MNHILSAIVLAVLAVLPAVAQDFDAERKRIRKERTEANERFQAREKDCYGKFAVTDCLDGARKERNAKVAELRRQEVVLNDTDRKQRAALRLREIDGRKAEQARGDDPERRARAAADQQERAARAAGKAQTRAARQAERGAEQGGEPAAAATEPLLPRGKPRATRAFDGPKQDAAEAARKRHQFEARRKEAEAHKAEVLERNAKREKAPAGDLPAP